MDQTKPYLKPRCAGLASQPATVANRVGNLLDNLAMQVNLFIAEGEMLAELDAMRRNICDRLKAEGWQIYINESDRYVVKPPEETP